MIIGRFFRSLYVGRMTEYFEFDVPEFMFSMSRTSGIKFHRQPFKSPRDQADFLFGITTLTRSRMETSLITH